MSKRDTLANRFEAKYIPEPNSGCWLWTAALNPSRIRKDRQRVSPGWRSRPRSSG